MPDRHDRAQRTASTSRRRPAARSAENRVLVEEERDARRWWSRHRREPRDALGARRCHCEHHGWNEHRYMCEGRSVRFADERCLGCFVDCHVAAALRRHPRGLVGRQLSLFLLGLAAAVIANLAVDATRERSPRGRKPDDHHQRQHECREEGPAERPTHMGILTGWSERSRVFLAFKGRPAPAGRWRD